VKRFRAPSQPDASWWERKRLRILSRHGGLWDFGGILGELLRTALPCWVVRSESKRLLYLAWEVGSVAVPPHLFRYDTDLSFSIYMGPFVGRQWERRLSPVTGSSLCVTPRGSVR